MALEDETGLVNVMCSVGLWKRFRSVAVNASGLLVRGKVDAADGAFVVVADKIEECQVAASAQSRDFR
ncbi:hypothetical protein HMPREF0044_1077 [Gleimia coleocanis DSM 15436]|uniref:Uncharacterized protein n=1 Tax=Gleimia coleocanis DSM 15436 TaxID=525245 RepID=C0W0J9_9ACTO|nr:hypothetical protein [Gleimia coleocanis]EEH64058.1 hypothetical protein HMPREF0044_1077 [Gleimia coleocanis DSM 15436]